MKLGDLQRLTWAELSGYTWSELEALTWSDLKDLRWLDGNGWITPKTDWISTDYYNYYDLNRVENNVLVIEELLESFQTPITLGTISFDKSMSTIEFATSLNRIENNIKLLKDAFYQPTTWTSPKITWADLDPFDYNDANRLEQNLLELYILANKAKDYLMYCGAANAICGQDNTHL